MVSARVAEEPTDVNFPADAINADDDANELMETRPICHHVPRKPEVP